jgi:phosphoglycolate phosphatase-like HAD superfamily hydrolase
LLEPPNEATCHRQTTYEASRLLEHAVKAAIFDFDGPIFPGRRAACAALDATYDRFAASVGRPQQSMAAAPLFAPKQMIAAAYAEFDLSHDRLDEIRAYYSEQLTLAERELVVAPDMITLLDELLARGPKTGNPVWPPHGQCHRPPQAPWIVRTVRRGVR